MKPASRHDFHRCHLHTRRHTCDADAVDRTGDRARDVRTVAGRGRVPGGFSSVHDPAQAGRALVLGDLSHQVRMRAGNAAVEDADDDVRASGGHRVRRGCVDLSHVPLEAEQRLARGIACGLHGAGADRFLHLVLLERGAQTGGRGDGLHTGARGGGCEVGVGRASDENADLAIARHDGAAGGSDPRGSLGGRVALRCENEICRVRSRGSRRSDERTARQREDLLGRPRTRPPAPCG